MQVHSPRKIPGFALDEYPNEYYNKATTGTRTSTYAKERSIVPNRVVYLRSGFRRPTQSGGREFFPDVQGRVPENWCESCGAEVFDGRRNCFRCRRRMKYGENEGESLHPLQACSGAGEMR